MQYVFMDLSTYEETRLPKDDSWAKWLKVGLEPEQAQQNHPVLVCVGFAAL
jgi:translation elongation factor P/translation initiation factor 5A